MQKERAIIDCGLKIITIATRALVNKMSDVESEELEDQGPNLGVILLPYTSSILLSLNRVMKETVTSKKKDTDMVKPCYLMAIPMRDIIHTVNVMDR